MIKKMTLNRILKLATFPICVYIFFMSACVSEYETFTSYERTIASFFDKVQTHQQTFSFEAEEGFVHETGRNTIIRIPPNAFVNSTNEQVTGTVEFGFIEVLDKSFIMLYDKPTITNSSTLLESAGVFYLEATQEEEELRLSKNIEIQVVSDNEQDMRLFLWVKAQEAGLSDGWRTISDATAERSEWSTLVTNQEVSGYKLSFDQLDWINCDRFNEFEEDEVSSLCLNLPDHCDITNTVSYVIFEDLNSVIRIPGNFQRDDFCYPNDRSPIGFTVSMVTIHVKDENQYELGIAENVVITENHEQDITMEALSLEQILDILAQF